MTSVRPAFDAAAEFAVGLIREPAVAGRWDQPSALAEMTVGALAGHLARQILNVQRVLALPQGGQPQEAQSQETQSQETQSQETQSQETQSQETQSQEPRAPIPLLEHYARAAWLGAALDDPANVAIREESDDEAAAGPAELAAHAATVAAELRGQLATEPADRVVLLPWAQWSLTLDDMLVTRIMEIAVHGDDLACSVGLPDIRLPDAAADIAAGLLIRLAMRRHGQVAVLRALSRAERAPASIAAF
jgi:hypothetical protein